MDESIVGELTMFKWCSFAFSLDLIVGEPNWKDPDGEGYSNSPLPQAFTNSKKC